MIPLSEWLKISSLWNTFSNDGTSYWLILKWRAFLGVVANFYEWLQTPFLESELFRGCFLPSVADKKKSNVSKNCFYRTEIYLFPFSTFECGVFVFLPIKEQRQRKHRAFIIDYRGWPCASAHPPPKATRRFGGTWFIISTNMTTISPTAYMSYRWTSKTQC